MGGGYWEGELGQRVLVQAVEGAGELEGLLTPLAQEVDATLYICHGCYHW